MFFYLQDCRSYAIIYPPLNSLLLLFRDCIRTICPKFGVTIVSSLNKFILPTISETFKVKMISNNCEWGLNSSLCNINSSAKGVLTSAYPTI